MRHHLHDAIKYIHKQTFAVVSAIPSTCLADDAEWRNVVKTGWLRNEYHFGNLKVYWHPDRGNTVHYLGELVQDDECLVRDIKSGKVMVMNKGLFDRDYATNVKQFTVEHPVFDIPEWDKLTANVLFTTKK